ncbi:DUF3144 domain-containing protein [Cupriavidus basilensis]
MTKNIDKAFYDRADAHIALSNEQLATVDSRGMVSASMMWCGCSAVDAWVSACGFASGEEMAQAKEGDAQLFL